MAPPIDPENEEAAVAPFHLPLDRRSPEPIFRQICKQIRELVDSGRLPGLGCRRLAIWPETYG